ncbi:MAG TPA: DUF4307 domain-containing protein, partial [Mycobacteriales bacterium]|nr:DUF4307 domain-containing protein [Mycobacteriales bacterium]
PEATASARRRPPGRYDEPSRGLPRALAVLLTALFLGLLVAVAWVLYQRYGVDDVPVRPVGFQVLGDDAVRVEFEVTPPEGGTAWCLVRAREVGGTEVGRVFVPVRPRDDGGPVRVEHELDTTQRAVTGEVPRCLPSPPPADAPTADPAAP